MINSDFRFSCIWCAEYYLRHMKDRITGSMAKLLAGFRDFYPCRDVLGNPIDLVTGHDFTVYLVARGLESRDIAGHSVSFANTLPPPEGWPINIRTFRSKHDPYLDEIYRMLMKLLNTSAAEGKRILFVLNNDYPLLNFSNLSKSPAAEIIAETSVASNVDIDLVSCEGIYIEEMDRIKKRINLC